MKEQEERVRTIGLQLLLETEMQMYTCNLDIHQIEFPWLSFFPEIDLSLYQFRTILWILVYTIKVTMETTNSLGCYSGNAMGHPSFNSAIISPAAWKCE